ncbi:MAG TPA: CPXCG motif-containing cysteine-rich protein [Gemmatimonadota bacterium]|nr:CPXCG motif-containing cysteine-rich protein [Gemmatimonadota bacterium]
MNAIDRYPGEDEILDDPDRSDRESPAPTDPGITTNDDVIPCPYCGSENSLFLEPSMESSEQEFEEVCRECGQTYVLSIVYDPSGQVRIHADRLPG